MLPLTSLPPPRGISVSVMACSITWTVPRRLASRRAVWRSCAAGAGDCAGGAARARGSGHAPASAQPPLRHVGCVACTALPPRSGPDGGDRTPPPSRPSRPRAASGARAARGPLRGGQRAPGARPSAAGRRRTPGGRCPGSGRTTSRRSAWRPSRRRAGASSARGDPRHQPLHAQHPAKRPGVAGRELVVAGQRLLAGLLAGEHAAQLAAAGQTEVQRGPDPLGGQRQAVAGRVADEEDAVLGGRAQRVGDPVALVADRVGARGPRPAGRSARARESGGRTSRRRSASRRRPGSSSRSRRARSRGRSTPRGPGPAPNGCTSSPRESSASGGCTFAPAPSTRRQPSASTISGARISPRSVSTAVAGAAAPPSRSRRRTRPGRPAARTASGSRRSRTSRAGRSARCVYGVWMHELAERLLQRPPAGPGRSASSSGSRRPTSGARRSRSGRAISTSAPAAGQLARDRQPREAGAADQDVAVALQGSPLRAAFGGSPWASAPDDRRRGRSPAGVPPRPARTHSAAILRVTHVLNLNFDA